MVIDERRLGRVRPRVLLLDLGGVLVPDPWELLVEELFGGSSAARGAALDVWEDVARASGTQEEYWRSFAARLGVPVDPVAVAAATQRVLVPYAWSEELLATVTVRFEAVGLISNTTAFWFEHYAGRLPVDALDSSMLFLSFRVGRLKEDRPGLFEYAASRLDPATVIVIDDREENVRRARATGLNALLFDPSDPLRLS